MAFNKVTLEKIDSAAESIRRCQSRLVQAVKLMQENDLNEAWLPWSTALEQSIDKIATFGTTVLREVEDQVDAKATGRMTRYEAQKKKSEYEQQRREKIAVEQSVAPKKRGRPPRSKGK